MNINDRRQPVNVFGEAWNRKFHMENVPLDPAIVEAHMAGWREWNKLTERGVSEGWIDRVYSDAMDESYTAGMVRTHNHIRVYDETEEELEARRSQLRAIKY